MSKNTGAGSKTDRVIFYAAGDICVDRSEPDTIFELVAPTLKQGDVRFCQLETMYSERGSRNPAARGVLRSHPSNAVALKHAGFNVVSLAGNHCMDFCEEALFDTIQVLRDNGMETLGAGKDIDEARKPVIVERKGVRLGFLAYNTILPAGYAAGIDKPGCNPLKANTLYTPIEYDQPGQPCRISTYTDRADLQAMIDNIKKLRPMVDVLLVSLHFGMHFVRAKLADYQREASHAAIDAGADLIIGHHSHILKGIEVYKKKVIFYSLCNFAFDRRRTKESLARPGGMRELMEAYGFTLDDDWMNSYSFPADSRKTILVKCTIGNKKIERVCFLPVMINKQAQPGIVSPKSREFSEVLQYVQDITKDQGIETVFKVEGAEVAVCT